LRPNQFEALGTAPNPALESESAAASILFAYTAISGASKVPQRFVLLIICAAIVLGLGACGAKSTAGLLTVRGRVAVDGSKSMQPFNLKAETVFGNFTGDEDTSVETSGDTVALERLCAGQIDIASVTREISAAESRACAKSGVDLQRVMIAHQAAVVLTNRSQAIRCLKDSQLKLIWQRGSKIDNYSQLGSGFPSAPLSLYGPTESSAVYELFTSSIMGQAGDSRGDYEKFTYPQGPEMIAKVAADDSALGYFDYAWVRDQLGQVSQVAVDAGAGCVAPTLAAIQDGSYELSRPLYYYFDRGKSGQLSAVGTFVEITIANATLFANRYFLVPLTAEQIVAERVKWLKQTGRYKRSPG